MALFVDGEALLGLLLLGFLLGWCVVAALSSAGAGFGMDLGVGVGFFDLEDAVQSGGGLAGAVGLGVFFGVGLAGLFALLDA
ncbi:MAG: hypothetical protein V3S01_04740 [Dehalococcoidia bacterium]